MIAAIREKSSQSCRIYFDTLRVEKNRMVCLKEVLWDRK